MRSKRFWLLLPLILAGLWVVLLLAGKWVEKKLNGNGLTAEGIAALPENQTTGGVLPVLWQAPSFSYVDQDGHRITQADLSGHVWIADFIFTQCTSACPMMTAKMMLLQRSIRQPDIRFVSFSVDPEHDTPAALKKYAAEWHGDPARWILLSTDPQTLPQTVAGMKVFIRKTQDASNPILHSTLFVLVDQQGRVRGIYDSLVDKSLKQLVHDAAKLASGSSIEPAPQSASTEANQPPAEAGKALFASLGCAACHDQPHIAPPLSGVFDSRVKLNDGNTVNADEAYLRESITDPAAKLVDGYSPLMPSYADHLTGPQIDQLVAYIRSLGSDKSAGPVAEVRQVTDPVCKMDVQAAADTLHASFDGKTYYFCSDKCKTAFEKNPGKYVAAK